MEIKDIDFVGNSEKEIKKLKSFFEKIFPIEAISIAGPKENEYFAKNEGSDECKVYVGLIPRYPIDGVNINLYEYEGNIEYTNDPVMQKKKERNYSFFHEREKVTIDAAGTTGRLIIHFK